MGESIITVTVYGPVRAPARRCGSDADRTDDCKLVGDSWAENLRRQLHDFAPLLAVRRSRFTPTLTAPRTISFLTDNPLEHNAGTAEAVLDCDGPGPKGTPGTANITAVVHRSGADIVKSTTVTVVGPTTVNGLTLTLNPSDLECGNTILAVANAVNYENQPVSDNTVIYFTTDTTSGVVRLRRDWQ